LNKGHAAYILAAIFLGLFLTTCWCVALLPAWILPEVVAYHVSLTANFLIACLAYGSLVALPVLLLAVFVALLLRRKVWAVSAGSRALALLLPVLVLAPLLWIAPAIYWPLHHKAVRSVPPHAQELIAAIERYKDDHGAPPTHLDGLVPGYLSEIPGTGLAGFPHFEYHVLADHESYQGRFELFMPCPYSYAGPSALVYWPKENGYLHSWPQDAEMRLPGGDWVYVNMK
jgi:hypothetical protein